MPASLRQVTTQDIIPDKAYALERKARRAALAPVKRLRRIALGPHCTLYFESFETMLFQIQEMLLTEKGGAAQLADELAAYNPLIPKGRELVATVMFEIDDPLRRGNVLMQLGGVERHMYISVAGERVAGEPDPTRENTSADGKASAVQFMRFRFSPALIAKFRDPQTQMLVGIDHPRYGHIAVMPEVVRAALAEDFG